jgi:predicted RND superfamily exporter protein
MNKKYETVMKKRPEGIDNSSTPFLYRYGGKIVGLVLMVFGVKILMSKSSGNSEEDMGGVVVAIILIIVGILFYMISGLAKKIMKRNRYIQELETVTKENTDVKTKD